MKLKKYPNLEAEQARHNYTDEIIANLIGMKRTTYSNKKRHGDFKATECNALCKTLGVTFEYLFKAEKEA